MSVLKGYKGKWKVDITDGIDPLTGEIKRHRKSGFTTRKMLFNMRQIIA